MTVLKLDKNVNFHSLILEQNANKEIAETLELKIGTVKSRIFFTRKKLMEVLKDYQ